MTSALCRQHAPLMIRRQCRPKNGKNEKKRATTRASMSMQRRAAGAFPETGFSPAQVSSPAQQELPQRPETASSLPKSSSPMQPERAPPEAACSLSLMQRELLQKQPPPLQNRSASCSGSSPRSSLLPLSSSPMQPERAPPEAACSLSLMQRELLQKQLPPLQNRSAPSAGAPPEAGSSLYRAAPCSQSELPQKQPAPSAPCCGSSSRISLLPSTSKQPRSAGARQKQPPPSRSIEQLRAAGAPQRSLLSRSIEQLRAAGTPQKKSALLHNRAAPCNGSSSRSSLLTASLAQSSSPIHSSSARPPPPLLPTPLPRNRLLPLPS